MGVKYVKLNHDMSNYHNTVLITFHFIVALNGQWNLNLRTVTKNEQTVNDA